MTIRWTEPAVDSIERIHTYVEAESNQDKAAEIVNSLILAVDRLQITPMMGRGGTDKGTRELVRPPYIIVYKIVEDVVNVINIVHGSQRV